MFIVDLAETKAQDKKGVPQLRSNTDDQDRIYWGQELPQGLTETVKRYRESAERGHASAQKNLGSKYGKGQGVPQNHAEAYVWSSIAAKSGDKDAINSRDFAASKLSPEDLGAAQERAAKLDEEIQQRKAAQ